MNLIKNLALGLRFFIEVFAFLAIGLSIWNYGKLGNLKYVLSLLTVAMVALIWGLFVSPKATIELSTQIKLMVELGVILLAGTLLYKTGNVKTAIVFGLVYTIDKIILIVLNA